MPWANLDAVGHKIKAAPEFLSGVPIDGSTIGGTTPAPITATTFTQTGKGTVTTSGALVNIGDSYGQFSAVTNTGSVAGYGDAFRCFTHANAGAFDLCRSAIMFDLPTTIPVNTQYQSFWNVNVSPTDTTGAWGATNGELNVTNRGDDLGWIADLTTTPRLTGGLRFVPESQNFGPPDGSPNWGDYQGTAKNVTFGFSVGHSSLHNAAGNKIKTYTPFLVEPDAIGAGGRAVYVTGDTLGLPTNQKPYSPFGAQGAWVTGVELSGATFSNSIAVNLAAGQQILWSNGTAAASLQGSCASTTCNVVVTPTNGSFYSSALAALGAAGNPWSTIYGIAQHFAPLTVAALPACGPGIADTLMAVSDATAPTYRGALTGGGTVHTPVYCDGTSWTAH